MLTVFSAVVRMLGLSPQAKKVWFEGGLATEVTMLGVEFYLDQGPDGTQPMYCKVPQDKVDKAVKAIEKAEAEHWVPAEDCQSLLGILAFHGRVLLAGRWHLPFSVRALKEACATGVARMDETWVTELRWWKELLTTWNKVALLVPREFTSYDEQAFETPFTDASRSRERLKGGAGAVFGKFFQMFQFTRRECHYLDIMDLEGLVVVMWMTYLCETHPEFVKGKRFIARCDNEPFVISVNSRKSSKPTVAFLLGRLHLLQCRFSFDFKLIYIKSKLNVCADALSRDDIDAYYAYMSDEFNLSPHELVCVPVQNTLRNSLVSSMISTRPTTDTMPKRPNGGRRPPTSCGRGSAIGMGAT